jgi:ATP phosphoribosyltransferase
VITLALAKGRIFEETRPLLEEAGVAETPRLPQADPRDARRPAPARGAHADVPTYVQRGGRPGRGGPDLLAEQGRPTSPSTSASLPPRGRRAQSFDTPRR